MSAAVGNKYAIGNDGGRPAKYKNATELSEACNGYFEYIKGEKKLEIGDDGLIEWVRYPESATVTGLVLYLGFSHRQSLDDYEKKKVFSDIIKRARLRIENQYELKLHGDKNVGAIFALKNMGWRDKVESGFTNNDGKDVSPITGMEIH